MVTRAEETRRSWPDWSSRKREEGVALAPLEDGNESFSTRGMDRVVVLAREEEGKKMWLGRKRRRDAREMMGSV